MFMQLHSNFTEDFKIKWIHYFFSGARVYNHAVEQAVLKAHAVKAKIARYYTMQFGNLIREIEFTTLYGISIPLPCMQPHSMILRTVYVLVLVSPTTQLQLENCDH